MSMIDDRIAGEHLQQAAQRLRALCESRGVSWRSLNAKAGLPAHWVRRLVLGLSKSISTAELHRALSVLKVSPEEFIGLPLHDETEDSICVLGEIPAGPLTPVEGERDTGERIPSYGLDPNKHFGVRVSGTSMEPDYLNHDLVICRVVTGVDMPVKAEGPTRRALFLPFVGKVCAVLINDSETTLKRVDVIRVGTSETEYRLLLRPLNPAHPVVEITENDSVRIQGVAVKLVRAL